MSLPAGSQSLQSGQPQLGPLQVGAESQDSCPRVLPGSYPDLGHNRKISSKRRPGGVQRSPRARALSTHPRLSLSWAGSWFCFFKTSLVTSPSFLSPESESIVSTDVFSWLGFPPWIENDSLQDCSLRKSYQFLHLIKVVSGSKTGSLHRLFSGEALRLPRILQYREIDGNPLIKVPRQSKTARPAF